jgi:hypothetical protein
MSEVRFSAGDGWRTGVGSEWSRRGFFLQSAHIYPPGTTIDLAFTPEGQRRIVFVQGQVTWARTSGVSGMGVVFDQPQERQIQANP